MLQIYQMVLRLLFVNDLLRMQVLPHRNEHRKIIRISKPKYGLILSIDSSELVRDRRKSKLRPFFQLILVIFSLILKNFISQRVRIDVIDQFGNIHYKLVQSKINKRLLACYLPQILLKVLFRVLCLKYHYRQKLSIKTGLCSFWVICTFCLTRRLRLFLIR